LSGVDCALIVTEPTLSGLHDAQRVMELAKHFNISVKLVVNKYDLNLAMTQSIEEFCRKQDVPVIGKIVFDKTVVKALVAGKTIVEYAGCAAGDEVRKIWEDLQ
jgi:MinD superfamily P-loop ATPase